jgi:peptide/nickel transport system substrate-binding protein
MRSKLVWAIVPGLIALLGLALASCGGGNDNESVSSAQAKFAPVTAPPDGAQKGGNLTELWAGDVDHIDPGAAYYQSTYVVTNATQRTLLAWEPADTTDPSPDLADGEPDVADDFKTVTFHIRKGIAYSPPVGGGAGVNRDATSADVKYAIERSLLPGVANGYVGVYLGAVQGFKEAQDAAAKDPTKAPDISGIETPDDQTIVFHLDKPTASSLVQSMSLPVSAPVPEEYAKKFDAENPSTYGEHQVMTGPYMIDSYSPGKEIKLVRNPNWNPDTDVRPAYLDSVDIQEGFTDTASASRKILQGSDQVSGDFPPPPTVLKEATQKYPDQLQNTNQGGIRYASMNTTKPPFDDINVRKAVVANSNREDLRATRGGPLLGAIATHYIIPGVPGFEEAGGLKGPQGSEFDFVQNPKGDPALAAKYMKKAGFSSGKCEGDCDVTMVSDDVPPGKDTATVLKDQLEQLGFKVTLQPVTHDVMYTKFCDVPKNTPDMCPNVAWGKDFSDAQSLLDPTFNGEAIVPSNNTNWPLLDDPKINKAIDAARLINDPGERASAWAKVDDMIGAQAPAIPWIWDYFPNIESSNVAGVINLFNAQWDVSYTSLKQ